MTARSRHWLARRCAALLVAACVMVGTGVAAGAAHADPTPSPAPSATSASPPSLDGEEPFDIAAAKQALARDPVYATPYAPARFDRERLRKFTAGGQVKVVAASRLARYRTLRDGFDRGYRRPGQIVLLLLGFDITVLSDELVPRSQVEELAARHRRAVQQTYDMTAVVTDVVALACGGRPTAPVWRPAVVPADPTQLATIVRALELGGGYEHPDAPAVYGDLSNARRWHGALAFRLVRMPVAAPQDRQPDLLGPLHKRFPDDVVVVQWGAWLEAAGPDPDNIAAALGSAAAEGSLDQLLSVIRVRRAGDVRPRPALAVPPVPPPTPTWPGVALILLVGLAGVACLLWTRTRRHLAELQEAALSRSHHDVAAARRRARLATPSIPTPPPTRHLLGSLWRRILDARLPGAARVRYVTMVVLLGACALATVILSRFGGGAASGVDRAIEDLRTDSVAMHGPDVLDPGQLRKVIGDRPIAVVVLPKSTNKVDACDEITEAYPTLIVVVFDGPYSGHPCQGDHVAPLPGTSRTLDASAAALDAAEDATRDTRYQNRDVTRTVEHFVALLDTETDRPLPARTIPQLPPDHRRAIEGALLALVVVIAALLTARWSAPAVARRTEGRRLVSRKALLAELGALAADLNETRRGCRRGALRTAVRRYDSAAAALVYDRSSLGEATAVHDFAAARATVAKGQ